MRAHRANASAPKIAGDAKQLGQFLQTEGFDQISVCAEVISLFGIGFVAGAAEQKDGQSRRFRVAAHPLQELKAVHLRHLHIAHDEIGEGMRAAVMIFAFVTQIAHSFSPVLDNVQRSADVCASQCGFEQERVFRRVLDDENLQLVNRSHPAPSGAWSNLKRVGLHPTRIYRHQCDG